MIIGVTGTAVTICVTGTAVPVQCLTSTMQRTENGRGEERQAGERGFFLNNVARDPKSNISVGLRQSQTVLKRALTLHQISV